MAQLVKCLTLGFGSGHDVKVVRLSLVSASCWVRSLLRFSLSFCLSTSCSLALLLPPPKKKKNSNTDNNYSCRCIYLPDKIEVKEIPTTQKLFNLNMKCHIHIHTLTIYIYTCTHHILFQDSVALAHPLTCYSAHMLVSIIAATQPDVEHRRSSAM